MSKTEKKTADKQPRARGKGKPFPKGKSGNPNGRPKGKSWKDVITHATNAVRETDVDGEREQVLVKQLIVKKQIELALKGDKNAVKFLSEREEGMPSQYIEQTQKSETKITIIE